MPPRAERAKSPAAIVRRGLQDALAWPTVATLLGGAALIFVLPRFVPAQFLTVAIGATFAIITLALIGLLAFAVERWLQRQADTVATQAEQFVSADERTGIPVVALSGPFAPVAAAYADAAARTALRSAEREHAHALAQLGADAARALDGVAAFSAVSQCTDALRTVTAPIPAAAAPVDVIPILRTLATDSTFAGPGAAIRLVCETDRGAVSIDRARLTTDLRDLIALARATSPADGTITVHVTRRFRAAVEETPVRRTGDSPRTIVPRAAADSLQAWLHQSQPGAEVLSIVVSDAGPAPHGTDVQRAFDAFAVPRPGDPLGIVLATVRRTVLAARGTIWLDGAREGGSAVHLLLPIAVS